MARKVYVIRGGLYSVPRTTWLGGHILTTPDGSPQDRSRASFVIASYSNCLGGFEILFVLYKHIFIYHMIGNMNNFNELFKISLKKFPY